jgi:hypothetical protein
MKQKDELRFLDLVSSECNFIEKGIIKEVYMGILRALGNSLRRDGEFLLPDLARLLLVEYKSKKMSNKHAGGIVQIPETTRLAVRLDYKLKKYFKN